MTENQKPKTKNQKPPLRICVPVVEATVNRARGRYQRAARKGLWTELRLDYLEEPAPDLKKLFRSLPGPVIATNRLAAEGGRWTGTEASRLALLAQAMDLGVTGLDALTRIMGFLLICIAFQFVFDGFGGYIGSERFLQPIMETVTPLIEACSNLPGED